MAHAADPDSNLIIALATEGLFNFGESKYVQVDHGGADYDGPEANFQLLDAYNNTLLIMLATGIFFKNSGTG